MNVSSHKDFWQEWYFTMPEILHHNVTKGLFSESCPGRGELTELDSVSDCVCCASDISFRWENLLFVKISCLFLSHNQSSLLSVHHPKCVQLHPELSVSSSPSHRQLSSLTLVLMSSPLLWNISASSSHLFSNLHYQLSSLTLVLVSSPLLRNVSASSSHLFSNLHWQLSSLTLVLLMSSRTLSSL